MIDLEEKRLGTGKSIPSLAIASSCLDNIFAITGNSLMIGLIFNKGKRIDSCRVKNMILEL
jgi:hypothetical protein